MLLKSTPHYPDITFGLTLQYDYILKIAFVNTVQSKSPASKIFSNPRYTNNKLRGAFMTLIHGTHVCTSTDPLKYIPLLHDKGVLNSCSHLCRKRNYHSKRLSKQPISMAYSNLTLDGTKMQFFPNQIHFNKHRNIRTQSKYCEQVTICA